MKKLLTVLAFIVAVSAFSQNTIYGNWYVKNGDFYLKSPSSSITGGYLTVINTLTGQTAFLALPNITLTGSGITVSGYGLSQTLIGQNLIAGSNITISGNSIIGNPITSASYPTFTGINITVSGNGTSKPTITGYALNTSTGSGSVSTITGSGIVFVTTITGGYNISVSGSNYIQTITGTNTLITPITNGYNISIPGIYQTKLTGSGIAIVTTITNGYNISVGGVAGYLPLSAGSSYPLTGDLYISSPGNTASIYGGNTTYPSVALLDDGTVQLASNNNTISGSVVIGPGAAASYFQVSLSDNLGNGYGITFDKNSDNSVNINGLTGFKGIVYNSDYKANYTSRSLVDKAYVDSHVSSISGFITTITGKGAATLTTITSGYNVNVAIPTITGLNGVSVINSYPLYSITGTTYYATLTGVNETITGNGTLTPTITGLANPTLTGSGGIVVSGTIFNPTINGSAFLTSVSISGLNNISISGTSPTFAITDIITSQTITGHYTITGLDNVIYVSTIASTVLTLPTITGTINKEYFIKNINFGSVLISAVGSSLIDRATSYTMGVQDYFVKLKSDGFKWQIIDRNFEQNPTVVNTSSGVTEYLVQNKSSGTGAYSEFRALNDAGSISVQFGILNSGNTFGGLYLANNAFWQSNAANTVSVNTNATSKFQWAIGGFALSNLVAELSSAAFRVTNPTSSLNVFPIICLNSISGSTQYAQVSASNGLGNASMSMLSTIYSSAGTNIPGAGIFETGSNNLVLRSTGSTAGIWFGLGPSLAPVGLWNSNGFSVGTTATGTATLNVNGSLSLLSATITGNTTLGANIHSLYVNTTASVIVTIQTITGALDREYFIKNLSTGNATITITGGLLIEGASSYLLSGKNQWIKIKIDAFGGQIIDRSGPNISAKSDLTSQTGAVNTVTSYVTNSISTYEVSGYVAVTAVVTDVLNFQVAWTDQNGTARTQTFAVMGTTTPSLSATGFYGFSPYTIRAQSGTSIVISTVLTTGVGTITYDVGGVIKQLY